MSAGPHFDDDALSAHLDGYEVEAGVAGHVAGCPSCRARLDALAAAAAAIGEAPPPAPSHLVSAAVAHALDSEGRRSRRPVLVALAAAAVVVLGIAGVTQVGDEQRPSSSDTAARSDPSEQEYAAGGQVADEDSAVAFGGDLGDLRDPKALSERVRTVVEPPPTTTSAPAGGATAGGGVVASPSYARSATGKASDDDGDGDPWCEQAVADEYGTGLGRLVYRALLRWEKTPAVAVAYELAQPNGELDHRLYVLAAGSCQLLVAQTF